MRERVSLTATIGRVVAIVLATSLSESFFEEGSLYGMTGKMGKNGETWVGISKTE